jgi:hypothetical protein
MYQTLATLVLLAAGPEQIHLTFQNDPRHTMTVEWKSDDGKGVLEFGASAGKYEKQLEAQKITSSGGTFYVAEATDLTPGTVYHYRVGDGGELVSDDLTFATAPEQSPNAQFRFVAFGDSRGGYEVFRSAMAGMFKDSPDLFVFTGDATDHGEDAEWDEWFRAGEVAMAYIPFMPVYGNHDALTVSYPDRFALPQNAAEEKAKEYYYSFVWGNAKFIILNDNYLYGMQTTKLDGPQLSWLENELANAKEEWLFVFNHAPFYSASNKHGSDTNLQRVWMPLFDKYAVDMVFNGHDHNYERSKPMRAKEVQSSMENGTVYVVSAGVGAPLYENGTGYWTAKSESVENYTVVEIDGLTMKFKAKRLDGTVIDEFTYTKKPRAFADAATGVTANEVLDRSVFKGPLWNCSTSGGNGNGFASLLLALLPLAALKRPQGGRVS